jgi:hypothetical protein
MYMFRLGIFLRFKGIFGIKRSLRLPIKGGARARVKGFTTFEAQAVFRRFFVSAVVNCVLDLNVRAFCILVLLCLGIPSESLETPQQSPL